MFLREIESILCVHIVPCDSQLGIVLCDACIHIASSGNVCVCVWRQTESVERGPGGVHVMC